MEVERNTPARAPRLPATMMDGCPDARDKHRPLLLQAAGRPGRRSVKPIPAIRLESPIGIILKINVGLNTCQYLLWVSRPAPCRAGRHHCSVCRPLRRAAVATGVSATDTFKHVLCAGRLGAAREVDGGRCFVVVKGSGRDAQGCRVEVPGGGVQCGGKGAGRGLSDEIFIRASKSTNLPVPRREALIEFLAMPAEDAARRGWR